ncbi:MAG: NAD(P)H-dependent oxidoreductase, partial [Pseudomonadota bacterium]
FNYSPDGPVGLLQGKKAILAVASGGVPIGSQADFATGYMKQVLGFLGITDIEMIVAERVVPRGDEAIDEAMAQIEAL